MMTPLNREVPVLLPVLAVAAGAGCWGVCAARAAEEAAGAAAVVSPVLLDGCEGEGARLAACAAASAALVEAGDRRRARFSSCRGSEGERAALGVAWQQGRSSADRTQRLDGCQSASPVTKSGDRTACMQGAHLHDRAPSAACALMGWRGAGVGAYRGPMRIGLVQSRLRGLSRAL